MYTGYSVWLKVIRYCVLPLQVSLLFVFTQHFHIENTLPLQTALPRTFVHEHCSTTFSQTLHWWMTWKLFWSFNDSRSQQCCDTGCRDTPTVKANWLTWCNSCCGIFFTIAMGNLWEKSINKLFNCTALLNAYLRRDQHWPDVILIASFWWMTKWNCGMSQVILRKKKTLRQSAIVLCNACIVINELAPVLHLQVV